MKSEKLNDLSSAILKLHKALLEFQKARFEEKSGQKMNPYEALGAALNDPEFAWLKTLSQMVVEIDLASENIKDDTQNSFESANAPDFDLEKIKNFWEAPSKEFQKNLIEAIQKNPDISFLFSEVKLKAKSL